MLNKDLCEKCKNALPEYEYPDEFSSYAVYGAKWGADDEKFWKENGIIICPKGNSEQPWSVDRKPPQLCPYVLEQVVSEG